MNKTSDISEPFRKYPITLIGPAKKVKIEGIIDTGAEISMISPHVLKKVGIKIKNDLPRLEMISVGGHIIVDRVKIKIIAESRKITITPAVFKETPIPLILGMDFIRESKYLPLYIKQFSVLYGYIQKYRKDCILIIGNDTDKDSLLRLQRIQEKLRSLNYEGVLLKDYPDIQEQSIEEKMNLFGSLAKFVICENSYYSGHIDELSICARNRFVTVIMQETRRYTTYLQMCYPIDFSFIKKIEYKLDSLEDNVTKAVQIGESLVIRRKRALNREYKYREEWFKKLSKKG